MNKSENPFRIFFDRAYDYFTASVARRVFFFAGAAILAIAIIMRFHDSLFALCALYGACAIAVFASLVDSFQLKASFMSQLSGLEADSINRHIEQHGDLASMTDGAFSSAERGYMKKKKREFNATILLKLVFVIIFVVLFWTTLYN